MSESQKEKQLAEVDTTVVISPEDCNAALDFWKHFEIPIPEELQLAFDTFAKEPSFANQERAKLAICHAISTTDHEAFKDDMMKRIREECNETTFSMQFDRDFETTVTERK